MEDPNLHEESPTPGPGLTRRNVLGAAAALAATPLLATSARAGQIRSDVSQTARPGFAGSAKPRPRYLHASVSLPDGRVVAIGGFGVSEATRSRAVSAPTASVQAYDPRFRAWSDLAPMRLPRARHAAVVLPDGRVAVLGGFYVAPLDSVEIYDPWTNVWVEGEPLPTPMADHAVSVCGDGLLVTGGQDGIPALLLPFPA